MSSTERHSIFFDMIVTMILMLWIPNFSGNRSKLFLRYLVLLFILLWSQPCLSKAAQTMDKEDSSEEILILNSYHPGYIWSDDEQQGVIDGLRHDQVKRNIYVEYMDSKRHTDSVYLENFRNLLHHKYLGKKLNIVISLDNPALEFTLKNRQVLFRDVPVVFCGVNDYSPVMHQGHKDVTGIAQNIDPAGSLDIMLKLHPETREIFVINDYTVTGHSFRNEIESVARKLSGRVKIRYNSNVSLAELMAETRNLPPDHLILLQSFVTDKTGRVFEWREVTELFSRHSLAPVYGVHEERLGLGIVGGKLLSGRKHGSSAAAIALRVLAGEKPSAIPVVTKSEAQYMFDAQVLRRFNISESALPADSIIINRPISFYTSHKQIILMASQIIVLLCLVIVFLVVNIVQRRRAAKILQKSEEQFRLLADSVPDAIFIQIQEKFAYVNSAFCRMIGAQTSQELLGRPVYDLFHSDNYDVVREGLRLLNVARQPVPASQQKYLKMDKTPIDVEVAVVPFNYQGENGALVSARDISESLSAQEALRSSEERFRSIIENADVGYFFVDLSGVFLDVNMAWVRMYGYERREDVIGQNFMLLQKDDDIEQARIIIKGALRDQKQYLSGMFNRKMKDGRIGYHTYSARPFRKDGKVVGIEGFIIDITALKCAEDALRDSEIKFRSLFNSMTEGVALHELIYNANNTPVDYRILDINPAYEKQVGILASGVKGQPARIVYQSAESPYLDIYARVALTGEPYYFEPFFESLKKHFSVSVFSPAAGQFATIFQDITERKNMETALAQEKERLLVTLRSIGDGVITTDVAGRIILMNKVAEDLTGWSNSEASGLPLTDVFHIIYDETRQQCEDPVARALEMDRIVELANHTVLIAKDKTERNIMDSAAPIRDGENHVIGVVLVFRDTTNKKRMEDALRNAQKLEAIGILAAGIAHDFNNLLGGIFGYLEMIKRDAANGNVSQVSASIAKALATYERAKYITQQLLTFSKGGMPIRKVQPIDRLIRESVTFVLTGSNVTAVFDISDGQWLCNYDDTQITQVIDNIVINARESMPQGGTLAVSLARVAPDNAPAILLPVPYFQITIRDHGSGIAKDHLPHIFDPFFTTRHQGGGLGLATSYSIIKKHNGHIEVESKLGEGSVFRIYLPQAEEAQKPVVPVEKEVRRGNGSVLVMDDEDFILEVTSAMLKAKGYTTVTVKNGDEAISKVKETSLNNQFFSAAILDLTIPGGRGGKETVKELLEIDGELKIIASSGYSDDPVMASPTEFGFAAKLIKPFRLNDLAEVLKDLLS